MRTIKDRMLKAILYLSAGITLGVIILIVGYILKKGMGLLNFQFIFGNYSPTSGGGILPMIITTFITVLVALLIAIPIGVGGAIYLAEYAKKGRLIQVIRYATDSLAGIPSIIYGLFGTVFFVTWLNLGFSIL